MLTAIKTVGGWFVLMLLSTNLIGFVVRGFAASPALDRLGRDGHPYVQGLVNQHKRMGAGMSVIFLALTILYFYMLVRLFGVGVGIAAAILMVSRLPDLLFEIRTGTRIEKGNIPGGPVYVVASVLTWLALPVLWWSFSH